MFSDSPSHLPFLMLSKHQKTRIVPIVASVVNPASFFNFFHLQMTSLIRLQNVQIFFHNELGKTQVIILYRSLIYWQIPLVSVSPHGCGRPSSKCIEIWCKSHHFPNMSIISTVVYHHFANFLSCSIHFPNFLYCFPLYTDYHRSHNFRIIIIPTISVRLPHIPEMIVIVIAISDYSHYFPIPWISELIVIVIVIVVSLIIPTISYHKNQEIR